VVVVGAYKRKFIPPHLPRAWVPEAGSFESMLFPAPDALMADGMVAVVVMEGLGLLPTTELSDPVPGGAAEESRR
jgi:hypothetical protein